MKKITFILIALITGTTFAQNTSTATAPVNAEIVSPLGITLDSGTSMDFGTFTTSAATETVTLDVSTTTPSRNFSATDMEITAFNVFDVPEFTVTKDTGAKYAVTLAVSTAVTGGLSLSGLTHTLGTDGGNDDTNFKVGGVLTVPSTATAGVQTGQVSVTVTYE